MAMPIALPPELAPVQHVLERAMLRVERRFDDQLRADLPPVDRLCRHVESYRGKMLRPALVVLSGLAVDPRTAADGLDDSLVSDGHVAVGAVCEMIHMATLVHDDVLDEAETRRGGPTVNALTDNERAVILGDYLFSAAYTLCSSLDSQVAATLIGRTGMTLCAGELLQLHHRGDWSLDETTYFEIVRRKTASLIAVACRLGAWLSGGDGRACDVMESFGQKVGVAFQVQDDLLDLTGSAAVVGKPVARDAQLGKLTLPLIHHLGAADTARRAATLELLRSGRPSAEPLVEALGSTESVAYARGVAKSLVAEARAAISPLDDTPARAMLLAMADAVVSRRY